MPGSETSTGYRVAIRIKINFSRSSTTGYANNY